MEEDWGLQMLSNMTLSADASSQLKGLSTRSKKGCQDGGEEGLLYTGGGIRRQVDFTVAHHSTETVNPGPPEMGRPMV